MLSIPKHPLKVLVIGSGGREHALTWKLAQSPLISQMFCAPGNAGTALESKAQNIEIQIDDFAKLSQFCINNQIDFTVVGPDNALAAGIVDHFLEKNLKIFGPTKAAAKLEWSKSYAKNFMSKNNIPTAKFASCTNYNEAQQLIEKNSWAQVIKADGLALGKGVYVCNSKQEAQQAIKEIFQENKFGQAGETVILEEKLTGEEISLFILCDGKNYLALAPSQDYKRRFENDKGPNTGGMGAISPPRTYDKYAAVIKETILDPLLKALEEENIHYQGLLYLGILLDQDKETGGIQPKVLEFNARFGDPETQAVLLRLESDLLPALWACSEGKLDEITLNWTKEASCCVVAVNKEYPEKSSSGKPITFSASSKNTNNGHNSSEKLVIFHAGTKLVNNAAVTAGGRVLAISALAPTLEQAANLVYDSLTHIHFESMDYRKDIARLPSKTI